MQQDATQGGGEPNIWIGVAKGEELVDFGLGGAANLAGFDEDLYEPDPEDDWKPGEFAGELNGTYVRTSGGDRAIVHVTFRFTAYGERETMTATGSLEHENGVRKGLMSVTGGTGNIGGRFKEIEVDYRNPHKYTAS
jgi:hypothetical protein